MRGNILVILTLILFIGTVQAAKIIVDPAGGDVPTIQAAINSGSAGDIIEVHSGTYVEHVYLSKAVTLMGIDTGNGRPVINASKSGSALTVAANGSRVEGFNFTGSGTCGCGNAGIVVQSNNGTIMRNILYKNKYGIYVKSGYTNNTFIANDFLDNEIPAFDLNRNHWNGSQKAVGLPGLMQLIFGTRIKGNHYSDYDEPEEGCKDVNSDGICDRPKNITGRRSVDLYPAIARENP
jgi:parallel beta-helix repeat protein